jgi:uncharacterized membrane protein YsdA (DUF1294 family)
LGARINPTSSSSTLSGNVASDNLSEASIPIAEIFLLLLVPGFGITHFIWTTNNPIPLVIYTLMSLLTYTLYSDDKDRAKRKLWRTSEETLHLCELTGGWIGGFLAQRILRHKNRKENYQSVFWAIVIIHHIAWICWLLFGKSLLK